MNNKLMRYIPREYKDMVENIYEGEKVWNEVTNRWNMTVVVEWKDGEVNEYQNASYMQAKLKEFGR